MENLTKLKEIAEYLGLKSIIEKIDSIQERQKNENAELIIPIIGEYSSGKSSLLNTLINSKLETHFDPTTATIFEIRFGNSEEKAIAFNADGIPSEIKNIGEIKNKDFEDTELIQLYDTSTKIPSTTVLVDTPGLSSLDPRHQKVLTGYLPLSDLILLAVDINQGVTASVLKFIRTMEITKKRIYIVITKCDTKPQSEIEPIKQYIKDNTKITIEKIISVSALKGEIDELLELISEIQKNKNKIIAEITNQRIEFIKKEIMDYLTEMINSSKLSTKDLDYKILEVKRGLQIINSNINKLISELETNVEEIASDTINDFNKRIFNEMEDIAKNPPSGQDINRATVAKIEGIAGLLFNNYKSGVLSELSTIAREKYRRNDEYSIPSLENFDISNLELGKFSYNIDLALPGVQALNQTIAGGVKMVAAAGAAYLGGAALGVTKVVKDGIGSLMSDDENPEDMEIIESDENLGKKDILNIADTVSDIGSMISNFKTVTAMRQMTNNDMQEKSKGALESLIGMITEHTHAKPQRKRLIDDFITTSLQPEFKLKMEQISNKIISSIQNMLFSGTEDKVKQLTDGLEQIKAEKGAEQAEHNEKMNLLLNYKKILEDGNGVV